MRQTTLAASIAMLFAFATLPSVRAGELKPGDPAPALDFAKYVQGEPVKELEKGKIYVVEFWATWCGPCRATIPHLNELSKKHAEVTFIGADVWERDEKLVEPFVKEMGEKMTYRVALDNKAKEEKGAMAAGWMEAAGQNGIPCAFIVDKDSKIAWIGHPMGMDKPLEQIIAGKFDLKAEAAKAAEEKLVQQDVQEKVIGALRAGQSDKAEAALDEIIKAHPAMKSDLQSMRIGIKISRKDIDGVYTVMDEMAADAGIDSEMLNNMAWAVLTQQPFADKRDLDRAIKYAASAVEKSAGKDSAPLDTLARAYAMKGDFDKAVEQQQKAIDASKDSDKEKAQKTLAAYKEKKVPAVKSEE